MCEALRTVLSTVLFVCCLTFFCENLAIAGQPDRIPGEKNKKNDSAFYVAEGMGVAINVAGPKSIYLPQLTGWLPDHYYINHHTHAPIFSVELGGQKFFHRHWFSYERIGLQYSYTGDSKAAGGIVQFSDPNFNNYTFGIAVVSHNFMVVNQLGVYHWPKVDFFVDVGLGASLNKVVGYQEHPRAGITPRLSPNFKNSLHDHFSYLLGFGFGYRVSSHYKLEVVYRYRHNGQVTTGLGDGNYSNDTLSYTQASHDVMAKLVSFFDV